jgi:hypothetical protein
MRPHAARRARTHPHLPEFGNELETEARAPDEGVDCGKHAGGEEGEHEAAVVYWIMYKIVGCTLASPPRITSAGRLARLRGSNNCPRQRYRPPKQLWSCEGGELAGIA